MSHLLSIGFIWGTRRVPAAGVSVTGTTAVHQPINGYRPAVTSTRRLLGAAALLLAVPAASPNGAVAAAGPASARAAVKGAPGIGDPYFPLDGNGGIDVIRYRIHDTYRFSDRRLRGKTRITLRATQALTTFNLDFLLPVHRVTVDGSNAVYDQGSRPHELVIKPSSPLAAGELVSVLVRYAGFPEQHSYRGERNWLASDHEVVTMNEPHMAPWWFPANDHPRDKALVDMRISVPRGKQVIANGRLLSRRNDGSLTTYHWRADEPMVPYLAFFAAGRFAVSQGTHDGLPWLVAVSRRLAPSVRQESMKVLQRTPEVVAWLETRLGEYPFSQTGGLATSLDPGFALENQTRPTYYAISKNGFSTVVHELAHQWFGDSVAVARWQDIWLNEGFASFMEAAYAEAHGGRDAQQFLESTWQAFGENDPFWMLPIGDPGSDSIFAWPVYLRGSMTLQALRHRIGETAFWTILRTWAAEREGGNGTTEDFVALAEMVSGQDLDGFFETWLFADTRPAHTAENGF
jgi:aminopeptidase N